MVQDYNEGNLYENLIKNIFEKKFDLNIKLFPYEKYPDLQNNGIDAEIISNDGSKNITLQIKLFRNTLKYGTFPWEVSRYLVKEKKFIEEPHKADYHIIIDPIPEGDTIKNHIWIIKTGEIPKYFFDLWEKVIEEKGEPSEENSNWTKKKGLVEDYYIIYYKHEQLYQLIKKHTAYQRNVRFFLNKSNITQKKILIELKKEIQEKFLRNMPVESDIFEKKEEFNFFNNK